MQRHQELDAALHRLGRRQQLEAEPAGPARHGELAEQAAVDERPGQPRGRLGRERDRQRRAGVDRRAERDQRVDALAAAERRGLVGEHAALRVAGRG